MGTPKRTGRGWPVRRFVVVDRSMEPALVEGQGLIGLRTRQARIGELRVLPHPERPDFWLVKRVAEVLDDGRMRVRSDNAEVTRADSRTFGPVPVRGTYRVILSVRPRRRQPSNGSQWPSA